MSKTGSIYLSREQYDRLREVCENEGCTPYSLVKRVVLDHIWAYPSENSPAKEKKPIKQDIEEVTDIVPEPETPETDVDELSESIRKLLERKSD